jgi:transposase
MQQAAQMIDWYRARWEIEMYFHVLKNGCRVEALQLRRRGAAGCPVGWLPGSQG